MVAVKFWLDVMALFFCQPDLALISQSLCKFLMMQVKKKTFFLRAILQASPNLENKAWKATLNT